MMLSNEWVEMGLGPGTAAGMSPLQMIGEALEEGILVQGVDGHIAYANQRAAEGLGYPSAAELLARSLDEVTGRFQLLDEWGQPLPGEELPGRMALAGKIMPYRLLRWRLTHDGRERWMLVYAAPLFDDQGLVQYVVTVFRDITRHEAERRTREQYAAQLHALTEVALALNRAEEYGSALRLVADRIQALIGVRAVLADIALEGNGVPIAPLLVELDAAYEGWRPLFQSPAFRDFLYTQLAQAGGPLRLSLAQLMEEPAWQRFELGSLQPPLTDGLLMVPLLRRDGRLAGALQVAAKQAGELNTEDEALVVQLAQMATASIEHVRLLEAERRRSAELTRSNTLIGILGRMAARIGISSGFEGVLQGLAAELQALDVACVVAVCGLDNKVLIVRHSSLAPLALTRTEQLVGLRMEGFRIRRERYPYFEAVVEQKQPQFVEAMTASNLAPLPGLPETIASQIIDLVGLTPDTRAMHLPLVIGDRVVGVMILWGAGLDLADIPAFSIFASQIAIALENARLFDEIQSLAITDVLTNVFNRRHFFDLAEREFERTRRYGSPLSVIMLDIDHFKQVNDTYGHLAGDQALRLVAHRCRDSVREVDVLARFGGEEFVILLPECDQTLASLVAERLRRCVAHSPVMTATGPIPLTISLGVAELTRSMQTIDDLINIADASLYVAKRTGRNRVCAPSLTGYQ